jgi:hypothetical protein
MKSNNLRKIIRKIILENQKVEIEPSLLKKIEIQLPSEYKKEGNILARSLNIKICNNDENLFLTENEIIDYFSDRNEVIDKVIKLITKGIQSWLREKSIKMIGELLSGFMLG